MNFPITTRSPAFKEVSVNELLYLRNEDKLTNQEIAERSGLSYATVLRYIGRQPDGVSSKREPRKISNMPKPASSATSSIPTIVQKRLTQQVRLSLSGAIADYEIDIRQSTIAVKGQTIDMILTVKDCIQMIEELHEVISTVSSIDSVARKETGAI